MRRFILLVLSIMVLSACSSAPTSHSSAVTGELTPQQLLRRFTDFNNQYRSFIPDNNELDGMQALKGKSVLILFGTWCHDSVREVPRFLKLLDQSGVRLEKLQLVAVGLDKKDPAGLAQQYNLLYTPTIIVMDNEQELYRMIERPKGPLALDLQQGLQRAQE